MKRLPALMRLAALILSLLLLSGCTAPPAEAAARKTGGVGFYFDTVVSVTLYDADETLLDDIWAACARYEAMLSKTVAGSDIHRVNHADGQRVEVAEETAAILLRAAELNRQTGGAFALTVAPLTALWDFTGGTKRMPTPDEAAAALTLVGDERIRLEGNAVTLPQGMQLDLGGIAKGYIADRVAQMCRGRAQAAVLALGGNVYVLGEKDDASPFRVGIQHPFAPSGELLAVVAVKDATVVTSGTYERGFDKDGVWYHHILDPATGMPARSDLVSVTVICEDSMTADAVATACIVMGREASLRLLNEIGLDAVLVDTDGVVTVLGAESGRFTLQLLTEAEVIHISHP